RRGRPGCAGGGGGDARTHLHGHLRIWRAGRISLAARTAGRRERRAARAGAPALAARGPAACGGYRARFLNSSPETTGLFHPTLPGSLSSIANFARSRHSLNHSTNAAPLTSSEFSKLSAR